MKGIECAACKKSIAKSLGRLEGVKTIRITPAKNGTHRLAVLTDGSSPISRSDAVEALGKNAPHYEIVSWSKSN
ncbi:MAG: heavy metal-associated domain-containing protein [Verrucomicrobiales bacterium]